MPESVFQSAPCFSATARYIAQMAAAGELMVIEVVTSRKRNTVEQRLHVGQRTDGHAAFADFALGQRIVGVVAHQRRKIESHREPGLALREQIAEACVGVFGGAKTGKLPHGPQPVAVHRRVDAARVGKFARQRRDRVRRPSRRGPPACRAAGWDSRRRS